MCKKGEKNSQKVNYTNIRHSYNVEPICDYSFIISNPFDDQRRIPREYFNETRRFFIVKSCDIYRRSISSLLIERCVKRRKNFQKVNYIFNFLI